MSDANKKNTEQDQAIHEYLQSLLSEVPDDEEQHVKIEPAKVELTPVVKAEISRPHEEPEKIQSVIGLDKLVAEVPEVLTQTVTEVEVKIKTDVQAEIKTETELELKPEPEKVEKNIPESVVPEWAETRFQCLLFNVSGLKMAVPLIKLNSVIPWDENITQTPNQTDWYLGLVQHLQNQVKVIDTALLVMPENRHELLEHNSENRLGHILLVDDYKWGLACTSIGDVIWLDKDEVKWRKNKNTRAWLSGTSLEHLCAIMDTEVFAKMLTKTD